MTVFMMVGCPYSGKSTYAKEIANEYGAEIVSSDRIRFERFADASCQKDPQKVFEICRKRMHQFLQVERNVIIDATSMTRKSRRSFLCELDRYEDLDVIAVVCAVPLEELKIRQKKRPRFVPWDVIMKQLKQFEFPLYGEGFSDIWVKGIDIKYPEMLIAKVGKLTEVPHETKWHKETIGDHIIEAYLYGIDKHYGHLVEQAALYHDLGKGIVKSFMDRKGNPSEDAHFYGHAGVGAHVYAAYRWRQEETIEICQLISYHMCWAQREEKGLQKLRALMGEELWKKLEQLHDCDEHGRDSDLEAIY